MIVPAFALAFHRRLTVIEYHNFGINGDSPRGTVPIYPVQCIALHVLTYSTAT